MIIIFIYLLLVLVVAKSNFAKSFSETIIASSLIFSIFIVASTEILSKVSLLNLFGVIISWSIFTVILLLFLFRNKNSLQLINGNLKKTIAKYKSFKFYEKIFLFAILFCLLLLLFQGIIYPPNNWDSLTYHMPRIMFWLGNESLKHYPTNMLRDLYQPPFAEYFILNINLLNGNDYFSNSVQWVFLVFTLFSIWAILDFFKVSNTNKIIALFLVITIPAVQLQSSTAKNDIVCSFFIITSVLLSIKSYYKSSLKNFVFLSFSIGLGMLTKGTAYIFLTPIVFLFAFFMLSKIIRTKEYRIIRYGFFLVFIIIFINIGHYSRNYTLNKNILSIDNTETAMYTNAKMDEKFFVSNFLKNIGLNMGSPFQKEYDKWIRKFHKDHKISIDNPDTNFLGLPYQGPKEFETHEDLVPNTIHLLLISFFLIISLFYIAFKPRGTILLSLVILTLVSQILLFNGSLRWQPWQTRLLVPIFILGVIIIAITIEKIKKTKYIVILCLPLFAYSFYFLFIYNNIRPIIQSPKYTKSISLEDSRFKKYFANQKNLYREYETVLSLLYESNCKKIAFSMGSDWEYPLLHHFYYEKLKIIEINVNNITSKIPQDENNVDVIVSNTKQKTIMINGKTFINRTEGNTKIWLYK